MNNPLQTFVDEAPEIQKAYAGFIQSLIEDEGLDNKTKQLIYIGMKMIADDERAVNARSNGEKCRSNKRRSKNNSSFRFIGNWNESSIKIFAFGFGKF